MNKPSLHLATVTAITWLNEKTLELTFTTLAPFTFIPGQFISLKVNEVEYRSYSICSDYRIPNIVKMVATVGHNGMGSNYLRSLKLNDAVEFVGPSGRFILKEPYEQNIFFYCTGTGIAPVMSFLYRLAEERFIDNIYLYWGNRRESDLYYVDVLNNFKDKLPNLKLLIHLSVDKHHTYYHGRITAQIENSNTAYSQYYLCGNPFMVEEVAKLLLEKKISIDKIYTENFFFSK